MSPELHRRYTSPQREEQANATRRRILAAAEQLFRACGFGAMTMPRIASEAGVAIATAYLYFPGKAAIVGALAEAIVAEPELSVEQVEHEVDPVRQMRIGARIIRRLNERSWLVADILRSARGTDERVMQVWQIWQERHAHAVTRAAEAVRNRGALRGGLDGTAAADILYAVTGTDVYRTLVHERGWSPDRYERWLFELGCRELLGLEMPAHQPNP